MVGMEYKGADSGNYAKEKYHTQILDEIHKLFCISVNTSYFFSLSENYFYSHTSNNFPYVQLSKEEIFIIIAYQEPR